MRQLPLQAAVFFNQPGDDKTIEVFPELKLHLMAQVDAKYLLLAKHFGADKELEPYKEQIKEAEKQYPDLADPKIFQQMVSINLELSEQFKDINRKLFKLLQGDAHRLTAIRKWFSQNPAKRRSFSNIIMKYPYLEKFVKVFYGKPVKNMKGIILPVSLYQQLLQFVIGNMEDIDYSDLIIYDDIHASFINYLVSTGIGRSFNRRKLSCEFNVEEGWKRLASIMKQQSERN